ncbi:Alpha/beta hydrolase fold-1 [Xylaria venustula]|nr:Alpha/beta hydrolase fold-1 [Xylaria venustula]
MPIVTLPSKPDAPIAYELFEGDATSNLLFVCLNGLGLPQGYLSLRPWILTYDRYGQGSSPRDPRESWPNKDPGYAHTLDDVTDDLHELVHVLLPDRSSRIVFVNNSIGAHVVRRYVDRYPTIVEWILFLDSNPGNTEHAYFWPNPNDPSFDPTHMLPPGTDLGLYKEAYTKMTTMFSPNLKNKEGFDRRDIKNILPDPSKPKPRGSKTSAKGPWITVVGHELDQFAKEEWETMKVPIGLATMYTQPLTDPDRAKGPLIAPKSGHFIHKDNPAFVAQQLEDLIKSVESS